MIISAQYLAGLFDGEGCVSILKHNKKGTVYYVLDVRMHLCFRPTLEAIAETFGGRVTNPQTLRSVNHKMKFDWVVDGKAAIPVLEAIAPYALEKKDQIEMALEYARKLALIGRDRADKAQRDELGAEYRDRLHIAKDRVNTRRIDAVSIKRRVELALDG